MHVWIVPTNQMVGETYGTQQRLQYAYLKIISIISFLIWYCLVPLQVDLVFHFNNQH